MDINLFKGNEDKRAAKASRRNPPVEGKMTVIGNSINRAINVTGRVAIVYLVAQTVQLMNMRNAKK